MVTGIGSINGALFGADKSRCVVMAYDATVLAGTQGMRNHAKTDRLLGIALQQKLPVVLFAEGGGGRPGDVDSAIVAGLHVTSFASYARLSGQVPVVGIVAGRCFAGNAALLGCSDVIIATKRSNIGMGGPAMVEGGGLGVFKPEQIGPSDVQSANGVIDLLVDDEAAAVAAARQYLSYFQGRTAEWAEADPALLRSVLPENRVRAYDMRQVMQGVADTGSLLELRAGFGAGIFTALARIEGRPVGLIASNPSHLGGAIDADAADKDARFMQLCNAHGLPLVSLVDTPGFMVGPEMETRAQVRHVSRMFVAAAHRRVPYFAVALRKGYGLRAGGDGDDRWWISRPGVHGGLAERRVRRHGAGRRGAPGLSQGTGGCARGCRSRGAVPAACGRTLCQRQGHQHGGHAGDRCSDRPRRHAAVAGARPGFSARQRAGPGGREPLVAGSRAAWRTRQRKSVPAPSEASGQCRDCRAGCAAS